MTSFNPSSWKNILTIYRNPRLKLLHQQCKGQLRQLHLTSKCNQYSQKGNEKSSFFQLLFNNLKQHMNKAKSRHQNRWQYYWSSQSRLAESLYHYLYPKRPVYFIAGAACSFSWDKNGITDAELDEHVNELYMLKQDPVDNQSCVNANEQEFNTPSYWEMILDKPDIKIWRLPYKDTEFMQYKVFGRFKDVTARQFFTIQVDDIYRKKWDDHVLSINVLESNPKNGEKVVQWVSHFPYPFNPREYVYVRRAKIYKDINVLVILSRSTEHNKCPKNNKYVRVPLYISDMVIKPHKTMDDPGLDFLLTYCDNPQTSIPSSLSSWVITSGIPEYVEKLHTAAKNLNRQFPAKITNNFSEMHYEISTFDSRRIQKSM
nr:stAR-related lipid transfer protein 7, mitochondrial [Ciona intestinalis]|eukprot:XP_026691533.1 stAR-related lipid transfer protein 7, mitochondrial [Ciona intestinalis]